MMNIQFMEIAIPAIVGVVSSVTTFFVARGDKEKDINVVDRQLLSEDEKAFRSELRGMIDSYKVELQEARQEIRSLREEVAVLHQVNLELTIENKELQAKVDEIVTYTRGTGESQ